MRNERTHRSPTALDSTPDFAPRFCSVAQAAAMVGVSTMSLYRAINAGGFPAVRIRGRLIVPVKAIDAMADLAIAEQTIVDAAGWVQPTAHRGEA
jgi:excisionase family DNA binding protein